ncbi:MAG TPA: trypsin-like serine protease [Tepidisphaeraceae bacterium]|jgi:autotransporter-associated beta strand protein
MAVRLSQRMRVLLAASSAVGMGGWGTQAATIQDGANQTDYANLSTDSQYASSGYVFVNGVDAGSGTLVAPGWVLTAAHVITQNDTTSFPVDTLSSISFGQGATAASLPGPDTVKAVFVESGWAFDSSQGNDLALIELSAPVTTAAPAVLYKSSLGSELTQTATMVGYGYTGTGSAGYTNLTYGTRLAIQNTIDAFGQQTVTTGTGLQISLSNFSSNLMFTDFDNPKDPTESAMGGTMPVAMEGASSPGDSGGGLFLTVGSNTYLAGVADFGDTVDGSTFTASYGQINGYTRTSVSDSTNFINSTLQIAGTWSATGGGSWTTPGKWTSGNIPQFAGASATFGSSIGAASTVTLDDSWSIGTVIFSNTHSYTLAAGSGGTLVMDGGTSTAAINDTTGSHFISAPVTLNTNTAIAVTNSGTSLQISGAIKGAGGITLSGSGNLVLDAANTYSGTTTVSGGKLIVAAANGLPNGNKLTIGASGKAQLATNTGGETLSSLTINTGGALDLTNNHLIITYTSSDPAATIRGYLVSGYAGGAWTGNGIDTSAPTTGFGLGYADGNDGVVTGLSSGQIEVKYTIYGDANLDGVVSGSDFTILVANLGKSVTAWDKGDFNYDGVVSGADFTLLASNLGKQASGADISLPASDLAALDAFASANNLMADVPEPGAGMILLAGAIGIAARRRRSIQS